MYGRTCSADRRSLLIDSWSYPAKYEELTASGAFKGTYETIYRRLDLLQLRSGLFGPVTLSYS